MNYKPDQKKKDGTYDTKFLGKEAVETVSTTESSEDGVETTKYDVMYKMKSRYTFSAGGDTQFAKNHDKIDWSQG